MTSRWSITTDSSLVRQDAPPGEIILEGCLKPSGLSQNALARAIGVPPRRMEIVLGRRAVAADTDLRLTACFGLSEGFFMRLQVLHDLRAATAQSCLETDQATRKTRRRSCGYLPERRLIGAS